MQEQISKKRDDIHQGGLKKIKMAATTIPFLNAA